MAHLVRTQPDSVWVRGYLTLGTDLKAIDQNTFVAINGDAGGSWTPAANLVVGGAGMICAGPWQLSGVATTIDTDAVTAPLTFGKGTADDVFAVASTSYTLTQVLIEAYPLITEQAAVRFSSFNGAPGIGAALNAGIYTAVKGARFLVPLRTYGNAMLQTATLHFTVGESHAAVPQTLPLMRIIALDTSGNQLPLRALDASTDANGFQAIGAPATGSTWFNAGVDQTFVYTCNQNQRIDVSKYTYWLEIIDESGSGAWVTVGNSYTSVVAAFGSIVLLDGRN
jgi:hypothetical protein